MSPESPAGNGKIPIRRALVSVYDKTGLDDLVRGAAPRPASSWSRPAARPPASSRSACR